MAVRKKKIQSEPIVGEYILARLAPYRREIMGSSLLLLVFVTLMSIFSITTGTWSVWWADSIIQLLGQGVIPTMILMTMFGFMLTVGRFKEEYRAIPVEVVVGLEMSLIVGLATFHLAMMFFYEIGGSQLVRMEIGGGLVGWGIGRFLLELFGPIWTVVSLSILGLLAICLTFRVKIVDLMNWSGQLNSWAKERLEQQHLAKNGENKSKNNKNIPSMVSTSQSTEVEYTTKLEEIDLTKSPKKKRTSGQLSYLEEQNIPPASQLVVPAHQAKKDLATMPKARHLLPPLNTLTASEESHDYNRHADKQAKIIADTLKSFDIPASVINWQPGPTVTQFEIKLETTTVSRKNADGEIERVERRVRVRKVMALNNDLALALSASPIRIQAPIQGKPLVGIEVPNATKSTVSLYGVMAAPIFKDKKAPLQVALGRGISGEPVVVSVMKMPHLLIAGATGSGKSVCLNTLITTLIMTHSPEQLRLLMIDPKMVELTSYNGIPHLIAPVVTDFEQVVGALSWATREMERRYKLFAKVGARSIGSYNQKIDEDDKLPYLVVIIDELADLMMMAPDEVERHICRIAQMARATGIHLVIATQRPSTDVITGLIKANFPARIAFAVTSQIDSRVILDASGAEKLLGQGDMLYMAPDSPQLVRLQGCYVSDAEIQRLVDYWRGTQATPTKPLSQEEKSPPEKLPWTDIMAEAEKDDMLEQAVKLVVDTGRASTSFLQRRLGIGYPRASRLMDQLEDDGVVGPAEGSKTREVLWQEDKDEANYAEFEDDVNG